MQRQHGANLFDGMYRSDKNMDGKTPKSSLKDRREAIMTSLKEIRDRTTFKDWRDGITGSIQFAAKIVQPEDDEERIGNASCNNVHPSYRYSQDQINDASEFAIQEENPLSVPSETILNSITKLNHFTEASKPSPIHLKTGAFLCLEIEKCFDIRLSAVSFFSTGKFLRGTKSGLLCPFVVVKLNDQEVGRTPALKHTKNPIWYDECFKFPICDKCQYITLEVWEEIPSQFKSKQEIGNFIGKCKIDMKQFTNPKNMDNMGFQEFQVEIRRWFLEKEKPSTACDCKCPSQGQIENSSNQRRETVRIQAGGNSFRRKKRKISSFLVEKPCGQRGINQSFKIDNPYPFRRKDIREVSSGAETESLLNSTYFKAILLMVVYLMIGVVGFSYVFESWSIQDALYFSVVTFSTVGYGDLRPSTADSKLFSCLFALIGIGIIGIALGFIGQNLVQAQIAALQRSQKNKEEVPEEDITFMHSFPMLRNVLLFFCPIVLMTVFGSVVVGSYEKWGWIDSVYWCVMTGTSVGYGDLVPTTSFTRWFSILYIPLSVGCISAALGRIANIFVEQEIAKANSKLLKREVTLEDLEIMNADGDGEVSPLEFVEHMLKVMHKVDQNLLDELHDQFEKLDADGSGGLQQDDLELLTERKLKERRQQAIQKYQLSLLQNLMETKYNVGGRGQIVPSG